MPAAAKGVSRITPRLASPAVSLARTDVDTVVTEHGVAQLRGKTLDERAEALIAIADPYHRGALADAWRDQRR
jgi:acyl-CoA hydrolase